MTQIIVKVASRCNLNCTYCYVFNMGDTTWKRRPPIMANDVFEATLRRIRNHCYLSGQRWVRLTLHGGEPCLIGVRRFTAWCARAREALKDVADLDIYLQTNATLLTPEWANALKQNGVHVGVSVDGAKEIHDRARITRRGEGSYDAVIMGLEALKQADVRFGILSVIQFGSDPLRVHRHLCSLGAHSITYLLPDYTHDTVAPVRRLYGNTPCADFLIPVFDDWWFHGTVDLKLGPFWQIARVVLGGDGLSDVFQNRPFQYLVVETDGEIEGLDCLRVCENGITQTGLNVLASDFCEVAAASALHSRAIFGGMPLPDGCLGCTEQYTCAGGYLPHRYSRASGFNNPSVWCADLLQLFSHIRSRLGVGHEETRQRQIRFEAGSADADASPIVGV